MKWYISEVLICISLMVSIVGNLLCICWSFAFLPWKNVCVVPLWVLIRFLFSFFFFFFNWLMKAYLFMFVPLLLVLNLKIYIFPLPVSRNLTLCFLLRVYGPRSCIQVFNPFWGLFVCVCDIKYRYNFIIWHVAVSFSKHHS